MKKQMQQNVVTLSSYKQLKGKIRYRLTNDYMFRAVMQKNKNVLKMQLTGSHLPDLVKK